MQFKKNIFNQKPFFFISHRGNSSEVPQNTIESFQSAITIYPDTCIEYDLRWTKDRKVVVMHDACLDNITNGGGQVDRFTFSELSDFDAGYRFTPDNGKTYPYRGKGITIALFGQVLKQFPGTIAILHIKINKIEFIRDVIDEIKRYKAENRVIIGGFYNNVIKWIRENHQEIATSFTQTEITRFLLLSKCGLGRFFRGQGDVFIVPEYVNSNRPEYRKGDLLQGFRVVTPRFLRDAHNLGYPVFVWTVNNKSNMQRLIKMGVNGILSDRPVELSGVV